MNIITRKNILCQSPLNCQLGEVALEQQAPWGRPPFGAILQLFFGRTRGICIESECPSSNRAEKRVEAPGPCCTLEFAVLSRPDGQQPKKTYAASPCRMDRLSPRTGGLRLVAARQIVQQVQRSCAHACWRALRRPRGPSAGGGLWLESSSARGGCSGAV